MSLRDRLLIAATVALTGPARLSAEPPPSLPLTVQCSAVLAMSDDSGTMSMQNPGSLYNMVLGGTTLVALIDRVGPAAARQRLGVTAAQADPLFNGQMVVALDALVMYDRRYCADHPLDTLQQAVDNLVAQVLYRK